MASWAQVWQVACCLAGGRLPALRPPDSGSSADVTSRPDGARVGCSPSWRGTCCAGPAGRVSKCGFCRWAAHLCWQFCPHLLTLLWSEEDPSGPRNFTTPSWNRWLKRSLFFS